MSRLDRLFSDRRRILKLLAFGAAAAAFGFGFILWPREKKPSFAEIVRDPAAWPGAVVGPELLRSRGSEGSEILFDAYGSGLRFSFPPEENGGPLREEAHQVPMGGYASVTARHLDGLRFELVRLESDPYRKWKLALSGATALAVAALLPIFFRISRGGLRPRSNDRGEIR